MKKILIAAVLLSTLAGASNYPLKSEKKLNWREAMLFCQNASSVEQYSLPTEKFILSLSKNERDLLDPTDRFWLNTHDSEFNTSLAYAVGHKFTMSNISLPSHFKLNAYCYLKKDINKK